MAPRAAKESKTAEGVRLAGVWASASARLFHGAACGCGQAIGADVDPAAAGADILAYLEARYAEQGDDLLLAFVRDALAREAARDFSGWLFSLDRAPIDAAARVRLLNDLATTLSPLEGAGGFRCT